MRPLLEKFYLWTENRIMTKNIIRIDSLDWGWASKPEICFTNKGPSGLLVLFSNRQLMYLWFNSWELQPYSSYQSGATLIGVESLCTAVCRTSRDFSRFCIDTLITFYYNKHVAVQYNGLRYDIFILHWKKTIGRNCIMP